MGFLFVPLLPLQLWLLVSCCAWIERTEAAEAIQLSMTSSPSPLALPAGSSASIACSFTPRPVYIFWSYAASAQAPMQILALCHTESGGCSLKAPFLTDWTAARPSVSVNGSLRLGAVGLEQDGVYQCEGIGGTEATKANVSLTVLVPPGQPELLGIATTPSSPRLTAVEGSPLGLACQCPGANPPARIDWLRRPGGAAGVAGFVPLPPNASAWSPPAAKFGASRSDLMLNATSQDDQTQLACRCLDPLANLSSTPVSITVYYGPKVLPVSSQMVLLGDRVEFNCSAVANPTPRVYIARGNVTVSAIAQLSVSHVIASATKSDAGSYACVAETSFPSGASRSQRQAFYLDVYYSPEISIRLLSNAVDSSSSPSGQISVASAQEGARLRLDCSVSANPPPNLVWWRRSSDSGASPPANGSSVLTLDPLARSHAGQWVCEARSSAVTTAAGAASNQPMRREFSAQASIDIIVEYAPGVPEVRSTAASPVVAGQSASLVCQPSADNPGVPVPEFAWSRFTTGAEAGAAGLTPLVRSPILQFSPASLADSGLYYCTPENSVGRGPAASVALEVVQSPVWLTTSAWPSVLTVNASSGDVLLDCSTLAKPEALTRWFKDGAEIVAGDAAGDATKNRIIEEAYDPMRHISTGTLRLTQLGPNANGDYLCTAQNGFGKIERSLRMVVNFAPSILTDTAKVALDSVAAASSGVSLECLTEAQPEPTVTWELLSEAGATQLVGNLAPERPPAYRYRAILPGVKRTGGYACRVRNQLGERSHVIQVVSPGPPEAPTNLTVLSTGWDHAVLAWRPGFDGGRSAEFLVTFASTSDVGRFGLASAQSGRASLSADALSPDSTLTFNATQLLPGTVYSFSVLAKNSLGVSGASANVVNATTKELLLPGVGGVRADTGAMTLSFLAPSDGYCVRVEASADGGTTWSPYRRCDTETRLTGVSFTSAYRLFVCLLSRPAVCGPPVTTQSISSLPEVSSLTIAIVAAGCAVLILCLLLVLLFFCLRNRRLAKGGKGGDGGGSSDNSEQSSHRDASSVERKPSNSQQHGHLRHQQLKPAGQQQQQQQFVMVSPHPSLTSTDETSVDQSSGRVFATLISANNPLVPAAGLHNNNECSDSDHSGGSLLLQTSLHRQQQQQQHQRKIIYEVVV